MSTIPITRAAEAAFVARVQGLGCPRGAMYAVPLSVLLWALLLKGILS